jgi:hypothetical protein
VHRIIVLAIVTVLMAAAGSHALRGARHEVSAAHTAVSLLRCDSDALDQYDPGSPTASADPTAPCAGVARRLQAETGAGEAAVAPAAPGQ